MKEKQKILFIASGPAAPGTSQDDNPFFYLSKYCSGYVIGSTWPERDKDEYVNSIQNSFADFNYSPFRYSNSPSIVRNFIHIFNYLRLGSRILKQTKIDLIISYGFLAPGISSALLSMMFKKPLLVEVPGVPHKAIEFTNSKSKKFAKFVLDFSIKLTLSQANAVWFLFKDQINNQRLLSGKKIFVSHDFAPVSMYQPKEVNENIISFIGYPWDLKGVDILIKAFKIVNQTYPETKLRVAGHCPNRKPYEELARGFEDKIEFFKGMDRKACIDFITSTKIFVLPSRTEAMGRVLLEAMSAQKVIIGSNVDGIPHYIKDGETGLLFNNQDFEHLAEKLKIVISDSQLALKLAKNARNSVLDNYTEHTFAKNLHNMILQTIEM